VVYLFRPIADAAALTKNTVSSTARERKLAEPKVPRQPMLLRRLTSLARAWRLEPPPISARFPLIGELRHQRRSDRQRYGLCCSPTTHDSGGHCAGVFAATYRLERTRVRLYSLLAPLRPCGKHRQRQVSRQSGPRLYASYGFRMNGRVLCRRHTAEFPARPQRAGPLNFPDPADLASAFGGCPSLRTARYFRRQTRSRHCVIGKIAYEGVAVRETAEI
jgi:hypothetical protein